MNTIITDNLAITTELPAQLENSVHTRYGLANLEMENAIATAYPQFRELNSLTRGSILDALFVMRQPVAHILNVATKEITKMGRTPKHPAGECKRGHDTTAPDSRYASGVCKQCHRENQAACDARKAAAA